jgi:phosphate transport system protein
MTRHIQRQLDRLKRRILDVAAFVEDAISKSISALNTRDANLAQRIILDDVVVDRMEVEVEEECLKILALYQPVAADLRFVVAALKINNDLERMGDIAKNIAKRAKWIAQEDPIELPLDLHDMARDSQQMVRQSLDAFVTADAKLARRVHDQDEVVDASRERIRDHVFSRIASDSNHVEQLMKLNSVSKHLERLADMATNIAEEVIYMAEGEIVRHRWDEE